MGVTWKPPEGAVLGRKDVIEGLPSGGLVIELSTIAPQTSHRVGDELRKRGMNLVGSPVGKTSEHAHTGTLNLMIGGEPEAISRFSIAWTMRNIPATAPAWVTR